MESDTGFYEEVRFNMEGNQSYESSTRRLEGAGADRFNMEDNRSYELPSTRRLGADRFDINNNTELPSTSTRRLEREERNREVIELKIGEPTHPNGRKIAIVLFVIMFALLLGTAGACVAFALQVTALKSEIASLQMSNVSAVSDMTRSCGGVTGGWMRVAELDMTNSSHQCPSGLMERIFSGKRTCARNETTRGCSPVTNFITPGVEYSHVCGRVIGYQYGTTDAFNSDSNIDSNYMDGVSLTHGDPRQHIWTFVSAQDEVGSSPSSNCPCTNTSLSAQATPPPAFVGNDYFCDTGSEERRQIIFYDDNPLWDGAGCGPLNTCCSFNTPPWFYTQLPQLTTDDIEMRVCTSGDPIGNEDVAIEIVEIYVQ